MTKENIFNNLIGENEFLENETKLLSEENKELFDTYRKYKLLYIKEKVQKTLIIKEKNEFKQKFNEECLKNTELRKILSEANKELYELRRGMNDRNL